MNRKELSQEGPELQENASIHVHPGNRESKMFLAERLEYGKYCKTHDGAILSGEEHGYLGKSYQFPYWLREFCSPAQLGVRSSVSEPLFPKVAHSTVFRPVLKARDKSASVFYRIRQRPEAGHDDVASREYTVGRYLWSDHGSPLSLLTAMNTEQLVGLTAQECGELAPMPLIDEDQVDSNRRAEIDQLLTYILSGVPICIPTLIDEEEFFQMAHSVWKRLPSHLQALFSAGWNVGNSLTGALMISCGPSEKACAALLQGGRLRPPSKITFWNQSAGKEEQLAFQDSFLAPGRCFLTGKAEESSSVSHPLDQEVSDAYLLPDFQDPRTIFRFRSAGWGSDKSYNVRKWINSNAPASDILSIISPPIDIDGPIQLLLRAWYEKHFERRLERAVVLIGSKYREVHEGVSKASPRYHLLMALGSQGGGTQAWSAYMSCARAGELEPLPDVSGQMLEQVFDLSLSSPSCLDDHNELLSSSSPLTSNYRQWLLKHGLQLSLKAAQTQKQPIPYIDKILKATEDRAVKVLLSLLTLLDPPVDAETSIRELKAGNEFVAVLMDKWRSRDRSHSSLLLKWLREFRRSVPTQDDPIIEIALVRATSGLNVQRIEQELEKDPALVSSLQGDLSAYILNNWASFEPLVSRRPKLWLGVTEHWHPGLKFLLLREYRPPINGAIQCDHLSAWQWSVSHWTAEREGLTLSKFNIAAPLLFEWAVSLKLSDRVASDLKLIKSGQSPRQADPEVRRKVNAILAGYQSANVLGNDSISGQRSRSNQNQTHPPAPGSTRAVTKQLDPKQARSSWFKVKRVAAILALSITLLVAVTVGMLYFVIHRILEPTATVMQLVGSNKSTPQWAPSGTDFVYTAQVADISQVLISGQKGAVQITNSRQDCFNPFWSPDAKKIYYSTGDVMWSVPAEGGQVTEVLKGIQLAAVHRDGKTFAVIAHGSLTIGRLDRPPQNPPELNVSTTVKSISFSPRGDKLAWLVVGKQGHGELHVIDYPRQKGTAIISINLPSGFGWFPNGEAILLSSNTSHTKESTLLVLDLKSPKMRSIFKSDEPLLDPTVAPDGKSALVSIGGEIVSIDRISERGFSLLRSSHWLLGRSD